MDRKQHRRRQTLDRQDTIADLLHKLLQGRLQIDVELTPISNGFVLIHEILGIKQFKDQDCTFQDIIDAVHTDARRRFTIQGTKVRLKPREPKKDHDIVVSKKLSWVLRHGANGVGLEFVKGGFLFVNDLLQLSTFKGITEDDVVRVVQTNDKQRFELIDDVETGRKLIRAVQGHSIKIDDLDLIPITDPQLYPVVVHGTYFRFWDKIRLEGLKRMSRTHIHLAPGEEMDGQRVISGMRSSAELIIFIDLQAALLDGFTFYKSSNNVILTEGDETGCLPAKYFKSAYQRKPRLQLAL